MLNATITVGAEEIAYVDARRLSPRSKRPHPDTICRYEWRIKVMGGPMVSNEPDRPIEHRYGDGPLALVARIIDAAGLGYRKPTASLTEQWIANGRPCMDPQCNDSTWDHPCPVPPIGVPRS